MIRIQRFTSLLPTVALSLLGACSRANAPAPASDTAVPSPPPSSAPPPAASDPAPSASASDLARSASDHVSASKDAKEEFRAFVATRQSCTVASDCENVAGACPFGCYVPVTKSAVAEVTAKLQTLGKRLDEAGGRCVYRCTAPPAAACVAGRCSTATP